MIASATKQRIDALVTPPAKDSNRTRVRTAFVSDVHLGSRYCQADRFLAFLEQHEIDELYLVGDFIDGWRLRCTWRWPEVYHRIFHRLLEMHAEGTKLFYTPGNHDDFLRHYLRNFGFINIQDEFVHAAQDGRRFMVMHGDRFDEVEQTCQWLSITGAKLYEFLLWTNYRINSFRRLLGMNEWHYCGAVKMSFKGAVNFISDFEAKIARHARNRGCDAVICGHIHAPVIQDLEEITYCNTGDWVEHCTALLEHEDGSWELSWHFGEHVKPAAVRPTQPRFRVESNDEAAIPEPSSPRKDQFAPHAV